MTVNDLDFLSGVLHRTASANNSLPSLAEIGLNHFVPYLMNRIAASWNADLSDALRRFDLTTPQMRALAVLSINSGLNINELSKLTVTEQSTMSRTLDTLEKRKLVRRRSRANDMRVREIEITEAGRAAFDHVWPEMFQRYLKMFKDIDEREFAAFVTTLYKVLRNIRIADEDEARA